MRVAYFLSQTVEVRAEYVARRVKPIRDIDSRAKKRFASEEGSDGTECCSPTQFGLVHICVANPVLEASLLFTTSMFVDEQ